jgi:hypothetical protein
MQLPIDGIFHHGFGSVSIVFLLDYDSAFNYRPIHGLPLSV